jgi:hypothetical protein
LFLWVIGFAHTMSPLLILLTFPPPLMVVLFPFVSRGFSSLQELELSFSFSL